MSRRSPSFWILITCSALATGATAAEKGAPKAMPKEAALVIASAAEAAKRRDLVALRALMVEEFNWSFGGDIGATQAIEAWKGDPRYLTSLEKVLRKGCRPADRDTIECPGRGGLEFRAGFVKRAEGWKMDYFVEGD